VELCNRLCLLRCCHYAWVKTGSRPKKNHELPTNANDVVENNNKCIKWPIISLLNSLTKFSGHSAASFRNIALIAFTRTSTKSRFFQCCFIQIDLTVVSLRDCDQLQYQSTLDPRELLFKQRGRDLRAGRSCLSWLQPVQRSSRESKKNNLAPRIIF